MVIRRVSIKIITSKQTKSEENANLFQTGIRILQLRMLECPEIVTPCSVSDSMMFYIILRNVDLDLRLSFVDFALLFELVLSNFWQGIFMFLKVNQDDYSGEEVKISLA